MGKSALILVLVSLFSWSATFSEQGKIFLEREDEQALYEERVLAREQALSGFKTVIANSENDFDGYRTEDLNQAYRDGSFSISAIGVNDGVVTVAATGTYGRAEYTMIADLQKSGGAAKLAALNIDGPVANARGIGGAYGLTGINTNPDGTINVAAPNGSGVHTVLNSAKVEMESGLSAGQVTGGADGASGSFTSGNSSSVDYDRLSDTILGLCEGGSPNPACLTFSGNQTFAGNTTFGTPANPVIMIVDGSTTLRGNVSGYGVLYIKGDLSVSTGTPRWEGIIYASTPGGNHEVRGNPHFYGAVILRSTDQNGNPVSGTAAKEALDPMDFTVRGNPEFSYSSAALDRLTFLSTEFTQMLESEPAGIKLVNIRQTSGQTYTSVVQPY